MLHSLSFQGTADDLDTVEYARLISTVWRQAGVNYTRNIMTSRQLSANQTAAMIASMPHTAVTTVTATELSALQLGLQNFAQEHLTNLTSMAEQLGVRVVYQSDALRFDTIALAANAPSPPPWPEPPPTAPSPPPPSPLPPSCSNPCHSTTCLQLQGLLLCDVLSDFLGCDLMQAGVVCVCAGVVLEGFCRPTFTAPVPMQGRVFDAGDL